MNSPGTGSAATRCSGWTETELAAPGREHEKFVADTTYRTPLKRWAEAAERGPAAVHLADPSIELHTGDMLVVDSGYTIF